MSDDTMKVGIELDVRTNGEELVTALSKQIARLEKQLRSITAATNAAVNSVRSPGRASQSTKDAGDPVKSARTALGIDRQATAELRRKLSVMSRMASQQARQERATFASFRASASFKAKADADEIRSLKAKVNEEAKAFRQRMTFATRMGRLAMSEERNAARERARSIAEATRAENRRSREMAASIRWNARLEITEARRADRERSANRRTVRSSGRDAVHHGGDAYHRLTRPPAIAAAVGGAATAALARRALGAEADIDGAEVNARIYAGLSKDAARLLRDQWASPLAESLGVSTAKLLKSYTDAVKLGIPAEGAKGFSELATQTSEAWSVPFETVTDVLGTVNSLLTSTGEAFNFDKLKSVANSVQYLAAKQSTTPEKLISFLQRGAGASQVLGMSQEAGLAFGSASTSLGNQAGQSGRLFDYLSSRLIEMPNLVKKKGLEGQQAKQLMQALGYSSAESMNTQRRANPDAFLPDFMERFSKIRDPRKQEQMIRFFTGREWLGEFGRMVKGIETYKEAAKLAREAKGLDAIGDVWNLHRTKLGFVFKQLKAGWFNILGEFGKVLSPIARQVGYAFLAWSRALQGGGLRARVQAVIDGFVAGLGFKDVPAMLQGAFGTPGQVDGGAISAWRSSSKAFAEGIRDVFGAVKSVITAFVGGDPEIIARWSGRILALSVALAALSPVTAILGGLAAMIQTLAAGLAGIAALKTLAGGGAIAGGGSALLMAAGGIIAAGFLAKIANANGILKPLDTTKGIGRGVVEFLDPGLASRLFGDEKPKDGAWVDPPRKPVEKLTEALEENAKVIKQTFDNKSGFGGLIHKVAITSSGAAEAVRSSISSMGDVGRSSVMGGSIGSVSGSAYRFGPGPLEGSTPGAALGGGRGSRRGGFGAGGSYTPGSGASSVGASDNSPIAPHRGKTFDTIAPRLMADLQMDFGINKTQAAGIVGNLGHESAGMTAFQEGKPLGGGRGGWGYAQWTGPRRRQFEAWAAKRGLDPKSYEANYGFLRHELQTTEKGGISAVKRHNTVDGATVGFERAFERAGIKHDSSRIKWARRAAGLPSVEAGVAGPNIPSPGKALADTEAFKSSGWREGMGTGNPLQTLKNSPAIDKAKELMSSPMTSSGWKPGLGGNAPAAGAPLGTDTPVRAPNTVPLGGGSGGKSGGSSSSINAPITINGAGQDAEAIANAVQRKISEQMNRRTHDLSPTSI